MRQTLVVAAVVMAAAATLPAETAPKTYTVVIDKLKFGGPPAGLHAGDTIVWLNRDIFRHSATARDGSFDIDLRPGAKGSTVLRHAGRVAFFCKYHPGMTGTLTVG